MIARQEKLYAQLILWLSLVSLSTAAHVGLIMVFSPPPPLKKQQKHVKLRVQTAPPNKSVALSPRPKSQKGGRNQKAPSSPSQPRASKSSAQQQYQQRPNHYQNLLPNRHWAYERARQGKAHAGQQTGEGQTMTATEQLQAMGSLSPLGRQLLDEIHVPSNLSLSQKLLRSSVRLLRREDGSFRLQAVRGDPYARVLLHQALARLKDDPRFQEGVKQLRLKQVDFVFRFRSCLDDKDRSQGGQVLIEKQTVMVEHCFLSDEMLASMSGVTTTQNGQARVGLNLLWPVWYALRQKQKREIDRSPEMRELQQHPAYKSELAF